MRRLAAGLTGLVALGVTLGLLPWAYVECRPPGCEHGESWDISTVPAFLMMALVVVMYMFVLGTVFTAVLVATLSNGDIVRRQRDCRTRGARRDRGRREAARGSARLPRRPVGRGANRVLSG